MLLDVLTRQDAEALHAKLDQVLQRLAAPAPAAQPGDLLSIEQVAAYTGFDRRTVEQWRQEGRFDQRGKRVYLPAYQFSGRLRFKRADVEAFGLGVGVLQPSPVAGQAPEPAAAPKKPARPRKAAVASDQALRVAS